MTQPKLLTLLLLATIAYGCAAQTAPVTPIAKAPTIATPPDTTVEPTNAEICAKVADLKSKQKQAHDGVAAISDPAMQASMQGTLTLVDKQTADVTAKLAAKGIICP